MRYRVVGSPQPLPTPVEDPLHKAAFSYRVQGVIEEPTPTTVFEVYAQRQTLYPYAERACRLLLACYDLARTRLGLDHALRYDRSLKVLETVKQMNPAIYTKSGIMLGLGETREEVLQTMRDLRNAGVDALTIGQYLRPTQRHLPVQEYIHPDQFEEYRVLGEEMGFLFVASGPFIRSSYNAIAFSQRVMAERLAKVGAVESA